MSDQVDWLSAVAPPDPTEQGTLKRARRIQRKDARARYIANLRRKHLKELFVFPAPDETVHIVSNGKHDYWSFVPLVLEHLGPCRFYASTWTMSRPVCLEMFALYDAGQITDLAVLTGLYFKQREPAVYTTLVDGLQKRGQRYRAAKNHAKVMLFDDGARKITIEGSANFTNNPRIEQNTVYGDPALHDFHRTWMEELLP